MKTNSQSTSWCLGWSLTMMTFCLHLSIWSLIQHGGLHRVAGRSNCRPGLKALLLEEPISSNWSLRYATQAGEPNLGIEKISTTTDL